MKKRKSIILVLSLFAIIVAATIGAAITYNTAQIFNAIYNPTTGVLQTRITSRGVASPQSGDRTVSQILNAVYIDGALNTMVDEGSSNLVFTDITNLQAYDFLQYSNTTSIWENTQTPTIANNTWMRWRNNADSDFVNGFKVSTSDLIEAGTTVKVPDLDINSNHPYALFRNLTATDADGGRESEIIFEGEQSGGEISILAKIRAQHDGSGDDEKGGIVFYANDGNDGASPSQVASFTAAQIQFQPPADATTFLQILDADGGTSILNIDSTNERIGIGTNAPSQVLEVQPEGTSGSFLVQSSGLANSILIASNGAYIRVEDHLVPHTDGNKKLGLGGAYWGNGYIEEAYIENSLLVGANYQAPASLPSNGAIIEGNVGIGTDAPDTELHVVGNIKQGIVSSNVANPPTAAELNTLFVNTTTVGDGWTVYIDDSDSDNFYQIVVSGNLWMIFTAAKAL